MRLRKLAIDGQTDEASLPMIPCQMNRPDKDNEAARASRNSRTVASDSAAKTRSLVLTTHQEVARLFTASNCRWNGASQYDLRILSEDKTNQSAIPYSKRSPAIEKY